MKITDYYIERDGQQIYIQEYGKKNGYPLIYVHGGPGGSCSEYSCQFFDQNFYHIYLLDQRGSGKSLPKFTRKNNTTQDLIEDLRYLIEENLNSKPCLLFAGSWGTTLALLFAEKYPNYVSGLILRGIFLAREKDMEYLLSSNGASSFRPEEYRNLLSSLDLNINGTYSGKEISNSIIDLIDSSDDLYSDKVKKVAHAYTTFESCLCSLSNNTYKASDDDALSYAIMENHYFVNNCFIEENQILKNIDKLHTIPFIEIFHGNFDLNCLPEAAYLLKENLPQAKLHLLQNASHSPFEDGLKNELIKACEFFKDFVTENN